jgi:hypothetical protein
MRVHDFDCNFSIEASIETFIDASHATSGYLAKELVTPINEFAGEI